MCKFVVATAALALISSVGSAAAANMPLKALPPPPPVFSWSGWYAGLHVGGAWGQDRVTDLDEVPGQFSADARLGVVGGGQLGFNVQAGPIVWGAEADFGGISFNTTTVQPLTGNFILATTKGGFYGDVTGRLGIALDRTLFYAKGGYAFFGGSITNTDVGEAFVAKKDLNGWTAGGGIEQLITPVWSVKLEYMYSAFPTFTSVLPSDGDRFVNKFSTQTFKIGANYKFGPIGIR